MMVPPRVIPPPIRAAPPLSVGLQALVDADSILTEAWHQTLSGPICLREWATKKLASAQGRIRASIGGELRKLEG